MAVKDILLLGNPDLYKTSEEIKKEEINSIKDIVKDLHDTMMEFRKTWGVGRAISAPQIGEFKRLIYMNIDNYATVIINPELIFDNEEKFEVWDDCMSFPEILVKVLRYKKCRLEFLDLDWNKQTLELEDDLSELLQHEFDHLNGILAVQRAIDDKSFALRSQEKFTTYTR